MGLWTYLCYLISVVLDCGLCFGFWFLCVLRFDFSWVWVGFDFSVCSLGWFLMVWVGYDFSVLWVDFSWVWVVLISLFFGWFSWVWVGFDFSVPWLISHGSGFWFLSYLSLGFEFLCSLCRPFVCNNITWLVTFQHMPFFFFWRYILSMRSQVLCLFVNAIYGLIGSNASKLIEKFWRLCQYHLFFFLYVFTPTKGGAVFLLCSISINWFWLPLIGVS